MDVNTIILSFLSTLIMSIPFSVLISKKLNDKYSILYFFITWITILYFNNDMKNTFLFIIYIVYSVIFILLIKKSIKLTLLWILIINILTALSDHISGFIFIEILNSTEEAILTNSLVTVLFNISIIIFVFIFSIIVKTIIPKNNKFKFQKG